jgi:hypothetical protein
VDRGINVGIAEVLRYKNKDRAKELGIQMARSGYRQIEPIEKVLRVVADPGLVTLAWRNAMAINRLPRLSPAAFIAIGDDSILPQVIVSHRLIIRYENTDAPAKCFVRDGKKWKAVRKYRYHTLDDSNISFPPPGSNYEVMDFLDFIDSMAGRWFDAGWHVKRTKKYVQDIWKQELDELNSKVARDQRRIDRTGRMYEWDRTRDYSHPNWHRLRWSRRDRRYYWVNTQDANIENYYAESRLHLPTSLNSPLWAHINKKDWQMVYSWARAMRPKRK